MPRMATTYARMHFSDTISRVIYKKERIALERNGKTVAALVTPEDLALLETLEDEIDLEAARKALKAPSRQKWAVIKHALGL